MIEAGLPVVISTDNVPPQALFALWSTVARKELATGTVLVPSQKLSREQALRAMTINGAYLSFEEGRRGSIEKGKYADLVVLGEDYLTVPEDRIKDIPVEVTIVGGKIVYQSRSDIADGESA
jgi:hypothetical protein